MKTSFISSFRGLSLMLGLAILSSAYAGPGPQFWRNMGNSNQLQPTGRDSTQCGMVCPDTKTVNITERRNDWPNGRGPTHEVVVGTEQVCTSCGSFTVMKPSLPNGRGPMQAVTVTGTHVCRVLTSPTAKQG